MGLDADIAKIQTELDSLTDIEDLSVRGALYRNLATLRLLNWMGGESGGIGTLLAHDVKYLTSTDVHKLTVPDNAQYAELYFEASDYDDARRIGRLTLGDDPPTSGVGASQHGRVIRNEDIFKYSRRDELLKIKIVRVPAITNLRLEVNYYA